MKKCPDQRLDQWITASLDREVPSHPRRRAVAFFQDPFRLAGRKRNQLGAGNARAQDAAVALDELAEVEAEEGM